MNRMMWTAALTLLLSIAGVASAQTADARNLTPAQQARFNHELYDLLVKGPTGKPGIWFLEGRATTDRYVRDGATIRVESTSLDSTGRPKISSHIVKFDDTNGTVIEQLRGSPDFWLVSRYRRTGNGTYTGEMITTIPAPTEEAIPVPSTFRFTSNVFEYGFSDKVYRFLWLSAPEAASRQAARYAEKKKVRDEAQAKIARWGLPGKMIGTTWSWYVPGRVPLPNQTYEWVTQGESARLLQHPDLGGQVLAQWRWNDQLHRIDVLTADGLPAGHITPDADGGFTTVSSVGTSHTSVQPDGTLLVTSDSGTAYLFDQAHWQMKSDVSEREVAAQVERDQAAYDAKRARESDSFDRFMGAVTAVQNGLSAAEAQYDSGAAQRQAELDSIQAQTDAIIAQRQQDAAIPQAYGSAAVQNAQDATARQQQIADEYAARRQAESNAGNPALVIENRPASPTDATAMTSTAQPGSASTSEHLYGFNGGTCEGARKAAKKHFGKGSTFRIAHETVSASGFCLVQVDLDSVVEGTHPGTASEQ